MEDQTTSLGNIERIAPKITQAAVNWLKDHYKKRFFLWVHYMDPHGPYLPPAPYNNLFAQEPTQGGTIKTLPVNPWSGKGGIPRYQVLGSHRDPAYYIAQYDGEIRFFDEAFGMLIERINALGLFSSSVILVTADHGEGMGEHDYYFAHSQFLYNGLIRVPLLLRLPGRSSRVKEIRYPVAHVDVVPTVLRLLSIETSERFRGSNLLTSRSREIFVQTHKGGHKCALIWMGRKGVLSNGRWALYNLRKDPLENVDLSQHKMDRTLAAHMVEMQARLDWWRQQDSFPLLEPRKRSVDEEANNALRALGYLH